MNEGERINVQSAMQSAQLRTEKSKRKLGATVGTWEWEGVGPASVEKHFTETQLTEPNRKFTR